MAASTRMTGGQAVARSLERHGVRHVFGIPGVHTIELYRGLAETRIQHVTTRHEQGAAFMADGYARASGGPGVACVITGPGLANAATAIATAYSDSVPLLILTSQIERDRVGTGRRLSHELLDQARFLAGLTPNVYRPDSPQSAANAIRDALASFRAQRPVPAVVEVAIDAQARVDLADIPDPLSPEPRLPPSADLDLARQWLIEAVRPVMVVGGGAQGAAGSILRLLDRLDAPVFASSSGKGVVPDDHPQFVVTGLNFEVTREAILGADTVIIIGSEFGEMDSYASTTHSWPTPQRTIQIDIDPGQIGRNLPVTLGLVGDADATVASLLGGLPTRNVPEARVAAALRARAGVEVERQSGSIAPWIRAMQEALPRDTILVADITRPVTWSAIHLWRCYEPRSWLRPLGLTTLGYAVPAAIGAKLARSDRPVAALVGDGGFMFTAPELLVAAELGLSIPIIVWNDHSYGEIRNKMVALDIEPIGTSLPSADLPALAIALGGHGCTARTPQDLTREIGRALGRPGPTVIEIEVLD